MENNSIHQKHATLKHKILVCVQELPSENVETLLRKIKDQN